MRTDFKMMRRPEVEATTGLSRSSIYALMANGSFPSQVKLSTRAVAWLAHEVNAWAENRVLAARGGAM